MQLNQLDHPGDRRLRFVFDDSVVSLSLAADATFADIAQRWSELAERHPTHPLAIDVTLPAPAGSSGSRLTMPSGSGRFL